jgi:hypothetical protein
MTLNQSHFSGGLGPSWNITVNTTGKLRIILAWDSTAGNCTDSPDQCGSNTLDVDLDLKLDRNDGGLTLYSSSWDSSFEGIDAYVSAGETYTVRLQATDWHSANTYAGIAWYNYQPGTE